MKRRYAEALDDSVFWSSVDACTNRALEADDDTIHTQRPANLSKKLLPNALTCLSSTPSLLIAFQARRFFREIVSAIDHCHLSGVLHRDLKLENMLLSSEKHILITDFGLGRSYQVCVRSLLLSVFYSFVYMAPWRRVRGFFFRSREVSSRVIS